MKSIKQPKLIENLVDTPCGEKIEYLKEYENFMPDLQLPLIPRLPYINIPDMTDLIWAIAAEQACYTLCVVTTPMIQTVSEVLFSMADAWAETDDPDYSSIPPLGKVPINPYISDEAILASKEFGLISQSTSIDEIRDYLTTIQDHPDIGQEEFIFLFLGNAKCNILTKLLSDKYAVPPNLGYLTKGKFKLLDEKEVLDFFSFLGSYINFIRLIQNSKLDVCPPNPCDLKDGDLEGIIVAVNDLCALLNPNTTLPPLPVNALLRGTGTNKFIVDSIYESDKLIAEASQAYTVPVPDPLNTMARQSFIDYWGLQASELLKIFFDATSITNSGIIIEPKKASLVSFKKITTGDKTFKKTPVKGPSDKGKHCYENNECKSGACKGAHTVPGFMGAPAQKFGGACTEPPEFVIEEVPVLKTVVDEVFYTDENIKLKPFEDIANKYWIEKNTGPLRLSKNQLTIQLTDYKNLSASLKQAYSNLFYGYLENSFPYVLAEVIDVGLQSSLGEFSNYQKGWKINEATVIKQVGDTKIYTRYTRPVLNEELEKLQNMKKDKSIDDTMADMLEFVQLKKAFQL